MHEDFIPFDKIQYTEARTLQYCLETDPAISALEELNPERKEIIRGEKTYIIYLDLTRLPNTDPAIQSKAVYLAKQIFLSRSDAAGTDILIDATKVLKKNEEINFICKVGDHVQSYLEGDY